jgi:hypothetical protein
MRTYLSLLKREFLEWRTVLIVLAAVYALGLVGATIGVSKLSSDVFFHGGGVHFGWHAEKGAFSDSDEEDLKEWLSPGETVDAARSKILLFGWAFLVRFAVVTIALVLMVVSVFYLTDAIYKERSDGSTFFYRNLPVGDMTLISAKLVSGTVGFLVISLLAGLVWVVITRLAFPGEPRLMMAEMGYSLGQLRIFDFIGDWLVFHLLLFLWLLPYATYFLVVSTVTRSRPLLVGVGAPLLLGLLWLWILRDDGLLALFVDNIGAIANVLQAEFIIPEGPPEWMSKGFSRLVPGESVELFGSFGSYILSLRTVISLLVAGGFFGLTSYAYRRNLPVS